MRANHHRRPLDPWIALAGGLLMLAAIAWPAFGEGEQLPHASVDIDVYGLLKSKDVMETEAQDSIWSIKAFPGRTLLQIPLSVAPGEVPTVLDPMTIKIRGARFLVYRMTDEIEGAPKGSEAARQIESSLPDGPPLITRKIIIEPSGKVRWNMDRGLAGFGGTVKQSTRLYALRLDSKMLEGQAPVAPKHLPSNSTGAAREAEEAKFAEDEAQYRSNAVDYRQLLKQIRALPDNFEADLPPRIWAVFELFSPGPIEISGPPPMAWTIGLNQIKQLRHAAERAEVEHVGDTIRLSKDAQARVAMMTGLMAIKSQPYTARAVAYALTESDMVSYAQPGDSLYRLMESVIRSPDVTARRLIIRDLARTVPPTAASLALLKTSASAMDPGTQMLSLQTMLKIDVKTDPEQVREAISEANHLVSDPSGAPPKDVIQTLLESADKEHATMATLANGVDFDAAPDGRRDGLIAAVVEKAPTAPLAAIWIDHKFLGSADANLVHRTLEIIAAAQVEGGGGQNVIAPVTGGLMRLVFGQAQTKPADSTGIPKIKLSGPIPIQSTSHSIFRVLQSTNPEVRSLAWTSLLRFAAVGEPSSTTSQGVPSSDICQQLLSIGLSQSPTPPQLVDMLAQQKDTDTVAAAMVRLVVRATSDASHQASMAVLSCRSAWPIGKALSASLDDRQEFATRTYENITGKTPAVTGLMRQRVETSPLVDWFAAELTAGRLPDPGDWLAHAGGEDKVLEMVVSSDPELARGAVSALVASAGGDDRLVPALTQKFGQLPDTRLPNLQNQWNESRREIYAARLQRAAGSYHLVLIITGAANTPAPGAMPGAGPGAPPIGTPDPRSAAAIMRPITAPPPGAASAPPDSRSGAAATSTVTIALGVIQLQADGQSIRLANQAMTLSVPDNHLAIRIEKVGELKNFGNDQTAKLPLEQVTTPVDLLPQANNVWSGRFELADGRKAEVQLLPAE